MHQFLEQVIISMSTNNLIGIKKDEKVVGILGGMGPYATANFYKLILDCNPVKKEWDHLRIIIDSNVKIPSRTRSILYNETSPVPGMIESINMLANAGADFVVVPCNSAHYFYDQVCSHINIPWLSLIKITAQKAIELESRSALIIGGHVTVSKRIYDRYLSSAVYLSDRDNQTIAEIINEIKKTNCLGQRSRNKFEGVLKNNPADAIVLACTELPIVYSEESLLGIPLINSNLEYARAVVKYGLFNE